MFGQSIRRLEDDRFLRGQGRYMSDQAAPEGTLQAYFLRSPHAHAALGGIMLDAARAVPGVQLILTGADLRAGGIGSLPCLPILEAERPLLIPPRPALAQGRVRHVGEAVACIIAETREAAEDAAELIEVDYTPLDAVSTTGAALAQGAPQLHAEVPGNLAFVWRRGDAAAVAAAMQAAAHVTTRHIPNQRVTCAPIEPRAALALLEDGQLTLHLNGQNMHAIRGQICAAMGLPPEALHLLAPDVGGGFGVKNVAFGEHVVLLHAARLLRRPIRWVAEMAEDFAASAHGRGMDATARLALDAEGLILALEVDAVSEMGAYLSSNGPYCASHTPATALSGCYDIPAIHFTARGAFSNTAPMEAYRGAGKPEANFIVEMMIEAAAHETGRDPQALRALNMVRAYPHRTALGQQIRDGDFAARLDECAVLADRAGFAARRAESAARGKRRGFGLTCFLETARGAPGEWARLRASSDGLVELAIGTQSNGQGHETSFPQYIAHLLDIPITDIRYVQADTARIERGNGHGGARSLHMGGEAMRQAAGVLLAHGRSVAARLLQCMPDALHYAAGRFGLPDGRGLTLAEIATEEGTLEGEVAHSVDLVTFPNGAHAAEIELDPETGEIRLLRYTAVDDYGRLLNPMLARGQVMGGVAQGIGQALMERIAYDPETAQLLSAGFMDYAMPRAADLPDLRVELREDQPTLANGLGVKGTGQAGCIAAPQAIMAAIRDAVGADVAMPATPEAVWRVLATGN
ncbi:molybdopterin cofactor-binding domain-containing protein [Sediminicoccus sp. KRV36]|uniref:xanthine dehydrogenase family protein molybdopterin-binding subunit n=1 Tax=Sediminicoccus sp. KRV36 TaxID=3133721 RepID=UPI00200DD3AF|nr:molybdopterin cofactor-binding domain-containing protein [Sediminicoccus rosea]UPY35165.1 xanthine dehydrogenase family protein molybdopterin-binding subunit [Sediminicoccus rosea]